MSGRAGSRTNGAATGIGSGTGTRTETYDPSHYSVPGQDHKGHSVRIWCRVQPSIDHEIEAIVQSRNWPFRTKGDFARWAIWEGVKRLEKMAPVPGSMIVVAETILESCKVSSQWLKFKNSIDATESTVRALLDSGNEYEALKLLSGLRTQVLKLEEASWREQWIGEFDKRFGHLWERAKRNAVNLA